MKLKHLLGPILGMLAVCVAGSSYPAWAGPPTDACSLLTPAQVSSVLAVSVDAGQRVVPNSPLLCGWEPGSSAGHSKRVVAAIIKMDQFTNEKTPLPGVTEKQAKGIGDEAHYMTTPGFGTGLSVRKGNFAFKIRVYGFAPDEIEVKERALALDVLAKL